MSAGGLQGWAFRAIVRYGSWPPAARTFERLRNLATYALGAGTASLHVEKSGEGALLRRLAAQWVDREVVVVDVGAHNGEYATAARSAFGDRMTLHCFEPSPETFTTLQARVGAHPRTTCHRLALGDEPGVASLFSQAASSAFTSLHAETFSLAGQEISRVDEVEVQTLDNLAAPLRLDRIDLLKVDVEGHELAVLKGARRLLEAGSVAAVQFEFGERNLASRSFLLDFVELLGAPFGLFRVTPLGLRQLRYTPAAEVFVLESNYLAAGPELSDALRRDAGAGPPEPAPVRAPRRSSPRSAAP